MGPIADHDIFLSRFPELLRYTDCSGAKRIFRFEVVMHYGYEFHATEVDSGEYQFKFRAFSASDPIEAFGKVTDKVREALSRRYLDPKSVEPAMLTSALAGQIEDGGIRIDGRLFAIEQLVRIIESHEGWDFRLSFDSAS